MQNEMRSELRKWDAGFLIYRLINPLTPELNPSAQRCLPRYFTGYFNF
jgi:hypothetical protein